jgi:hypothetical protein
MIRPLLEPEAENGLDPIRATRRQVLASVSALSLAATLPDLAEGGEVPKPEERGEPFDDGTYFDDGYGWVD